MAEVENGAQPRLALVLAHHLGLDLAGAHHSMPQGSQVSRHQSVHVVVQPTQKHGIINGAVLDDLRQPSSHFTLGQRSEQGEIAHHTFGLIEGADHVLA